MNFKLDYLIDSKKEIYFNDIKKYYWDIFISCYNNSKRVKDIYSEVNAKDKIWIIIPEYGYKESEYPHTTCLSSSDKNEADLIIKTIGCYLEGKSNKLKICIDITGFMRPQIIFLIKYLKILKFNNYHLIYSEPDYYSKKAETSFTISDVEEVRQIAGYEGIHETDTQNDVLILGVGYDHNLMSRVVLSKDSARLVLLYSLPSLRADMYQESLIRLQRVSAISMKISDENSYYASANDPFVTASTLSTIYEHISQQQHISNLYLCPLATKSQALGFSLFYLKELQGKSSSIIFPYSSSYSRETTSGIGRIWLYPICI